MEMENEMEKCENEMEKCENEMEKCENEMKKCETGLQSFVRQSCERLYRDHIINKIKNCWPEDSKYV